MLGVGPNSLQAAALAEVPDSLALADTRALRLLEESDTDALYALIDANRSYLAKWLPWPAGQTREETLKFIRGARSQVEHNDGFHAAIVDRAQIVGVIGFHAIDRQHHSTSIGYWLAEDAQGRGTMTRAARAMVDHALRVWGLNRVEMRASVENDRSRALIERLGFRLEGIARRAFLLADGYHDDAVYSMLAGDWRSSTDPRTADAARA